jgi:hypothetical protein
MEQLLEQQGQSGIGFGAVARNPGGMTTLVACWLAHITGFVLPWGTRDLSRFGAVMLWPTGMPISHRRRLIKVGEEFSDLVSLIPNEQEYCANWLHGACNCDEGLGTNIIQYMPDERDRPSTQALMEWSIVITQNAHDYPVTLHAMRGLAAFATYLWRTPRNENIGEHTHYNVHGAAVGDWNHYVITRSDDTLTKKVYVQVVRRCDPRKYLKTGPKAIISESTRMELEQRLGDALEPYLITK